MKLPTDASGAGAVSGISRSHFVPMTIRRRGVELRLTLNGDSGGPAQVDPAPLKALARARAWFEEVASGRVASLAAIARREGLKRWQAVFRPCKETRL